MREENPVSIDVVARAVAQTLADEPDVLARFIWALALALDEDLGSSTEEFMRKLADEDQGSPAEFIRKLADNPARMAVFVERVVQDSEVLVTLVRGIAPTRLDSEVLVTLLGEIAPTLLIGDDESLKREAMRQSVQEFVVVRAAVLTMSWSIEHLAIFVERVVLELADEPEHLAKFFRAIMLTYGEDRAEFVEVVRSARERLADNPAREACIEATGWALSREGWKGTLAALGDHLKGWFASPRRARKLEWKRALTLERWKCVDPWAEWREQEREQIWTRWERAWEQGKARRRVVRLSVGVILVAIVLWIGFA